jgi:excisionase family DNA binding protein
VSALAVTLTVDELHDLIRKAIRAEVSSQREEQEVLDRAKCAKLLDVTERTVVKWAEEDGMPGKKLPGGHWRFRRSLVLAWLSENPKKTEAA